MMKLYYWPGYCSLASHIVMNWIGLDFEFFKADHEYRQSDAFRCLNPSSTVPVLVDDDGWILSQNVAVLTYLAERWPASGLIGNGTPRGKAVVNRWLGYINSDVHKAFSPLLHPDRLLGGPAVRAEALAQARQTVRSHFSNLDEALADRTWIADDRRSVADAYLFVLLRWYEDLGLNLQHFENLSRVFDCRLRDPQVARALREEESGRRESIATSNT